MRVATKRSPSIENQRDSRCRATFDEAAAAIAICQLDGQILEYNPAWRKMLGDDLESRPLMATVNARTVLAVDRLRFFPEQTALAELAHHQHSSIEADHLCRRSDGSEFWGHLTISLGRDRHQAPSFLIAILAEYTERKQIEERLQQAERLEVIGRLAGGIAHDFNNLLTGILLHCDLLNDSLETPGLNPGDFRRTIDEIRSAGQQSAALTQQLLAFPRDQTTEPPAIQLNDVVTSSENLLRRMIGERVQLFIALHAGSTAVQAMKDGAYDYVTKPFSMAELRLLLENLARQLQLKTENRLHREINPSRNGFGNIIGHTPEMDKLYRIIAKAGQSTHPVLILGESGTGKELVAKSIHLSGTFRTKPFIPVDCGSLVPIESELFGHVRGAFTGAHNPKEGLLAIADGGTVFLDEIGELPVDLQAKLLRAIQEKEIRPVGSVKRVPPNVWILAATNKDLERAVSEGSFRRDLFFRLNVLTLRIPPLRERREDIPLLAAHFLERIGRDSEMGKTISDESLKALLQ